MDWLQSVLEKKCKIKLQRIGENKLGKAGCRLAEGQVLNRVVGMTPHGHELEADLRHAELIIEQLELENSKLVITPRIALEVKCAAWDEKGDEPEGEELPPEQIIRFRATGARSHYLQPNRPDIQYAVKEVRRQMSRPKT